MFLLSTRNNPPSVLFNSFPEYSQTCPASCSLSTTALSGSKKFFKDLMQALARSLSLCKVKLLSELSIASNCSFALVLLWYTTDQQNLLHFLANKKQNQKV